MPEVSRFKFLKKLLELWEHVAFLRDWLLPIMVPVAAVFAGYMQSIPWMWIIMAMSLTAMGVTVATFIVVVQIERFSPANKLQFNVVFQCDMTPAKAVAQGTRAVRRALKSDDGTQLLSPMQIDINTPRTLDKGQLGLEVQNAATYPISCILYSAETDIDGLAPPRSTFPKPGYNIFPGQKIRICDDPIDMQSKKCDRMIGKMNMVVKYGRKGKEKFEYVSKCKINIIMEQFGFVSHLIVDLTGTIDS